MKSIGARLGAWLAASVLVLAVLLVWASRDAATGLARQYVEDRLRDDAENLLAGLSLAGDGAPKVESRRVPPVYVRTYSGHYFVIEAADLRLRSRSLWDQDLDPGPCEARTCVLDRPGPLGQQLLVWVGEYEVGGQRVRIATAQDTMPLVAEMNALSRWLVAFVITAAAGLLVVQALVLRLSLRPLRQVREDCARLAAGETDALSEHVPTELRPLVIEMNRLLVSMRARLERSRNALGNLAHALKTPLTRAQQLLATPMDAPARDAAGAALGEIGVTIESQLRRARVAGHGTARRVSFSAVLEDLLVPMRAVYADKHIRVATAIDTTATVPIDREDLLELVGNLLDNAFKWAREEVRVEATVGEALEIRIADDGPGVDAQALDGLDGRGVRIDESTPGHGLGLAICRDIVQAYDGRLVFARAPELGGFLVTVRIPL